MSSHDKTVDDAVRQIVEGCSNPAKAQAVLTQMTDWCRAQGIVFEEYQWHSLVNHMAAMVDRAESGERLEDIDPLLFSEVSGDSIALAQRVVEAIGGIPESEKYLLSIHFENARQNG